MKEIVIDISNDGEIQIETRGFKAKPASPKPSSSRISSKRNRQNPYPHLLAGRKNHCQKHLPSAAKLPHLNQRNNQPTEITRIPVSE